MKRLRANDSGGSGLKKGGRNAERSSRLRLLTHGLFDLLVELRVEEFRQKPREHERALLVPQRRDGRVALREEALAAPGASW
eukprot:4401566-Pleurochrysis_carterae.AAC.1